MSTPEQITLPMPTMMALEQDPELMAELEAVRAEGGRAAMIEWLDEHGLTWHAGGTDPMRALADALEMGGMFEVGGPMFESPRPNRKARRQAERAARRRNR